MRLRVDQTARAERDLVETYSYINLESSAAAERFLESARATFEYLAETPRAGRPYTTGRRRLRGLRVWPIHGFRSHLVFYLVRPKRLIIVRVVHGARNVRALVGGP